MTAYLHPAPTTSLVERAALDRTPTLAASYELCRQINRAHGKTYYFATQFLPRERRHHVHALYAFARYADDMVDHDGLSWSAEARQAALQAWSGSFFDSLRTGVTDDPVLHAVIATVRDLHIRTDDLQAFVASMLMDFTVSRYATYEDLAEYMHGSAAVIGSMMLPVLGATSPRARQPAMDLGVAFQLTNFLRDIGEDWRRGRLYLPLEDLAQFGVSQDDIAAGTVTPAVRGLLAYEIGRARDLYRQAEDGLQYLPPASRRCIRIAHRLYAEILDRIEAANYDVFTVRAAVPAPRKLLLAATTLLVSTPGSHRC